MIAYGRIYKMKKLLGILVLGLLLSGNAYALETPLKKLSKYFKNGELIKISSYTVPGWPNQYSSIKDGSYKKKPCHGGCIYCIS